MGPLPQINKNKIHKIGGRKVTVENSRRKANVGQHMPVPGTKRRCGYCSTKKDVKRTKIQCKECNVGLCLSCFEPFHVKE
nr:unnamed protein product [Callosobruchus analis]